jgi:hypothetical protein
MKNKKTNYVKCFTVIYDDCERRCVRSYDRETAESWIDDENTGCVIEEEVPDYVFDRTQVRMAMGKVYV